jgi:hypothetical protein
MPAAGMTCCLYFILEKWPNPPFYEAKVTFFLRAPLLKLLRRGRFYPI